MADRTASLRFSGSVWCNLDIALRNVEQFFRKGIRPFGLTVIEWYILRALYEQDGQHASELARAVGRAATSFTPNLDKLQEKGYIERRPDASDRRAVRIYLTQSAIEKKAEVSKMAAEIDKELASRFSPAEFQTFLEVVATMQNVMPEN